MAKLTTTDVYGILTAHSNVVIKNDLTVGGILTASSLNASVFTVTSLNLISGIATTGPGLFFKTISTPAPASTIVSVYDGALYATSFNGPLTGNASGTAATVTGSTQANITNVSSAANGLTIAGTAGLILTVGSATTGAGTLFATSGTPAPAGTTKAVWDGNFYATSFNGPLTGNASGTAATVTGSTQANITNVSSAANGLTIAGTAVAISTIFNLSNVGLDHIPSEEEDIIQRYQICKYCYIPCEKCISTDITKTYEQQLQKWNQHPSFLTVLT